MPILLFACLLFLSLFQACTGEDSAKPMVGPVNGSASAPSPSLRVEPLASGDSDRFLQVVDDRTAGLTPLPHSTFRDAGTGETYPVNLGWRILPRQAPKPVPGQPLPKAASTLYQTWTDASGRVETRIYECVTPTRAQHQSLGCQVEPEFILVGGGAYADYGNGPGALLWESRPADNTLMTWVASSKDQSSPNPHLLYVYAVGMRLKGDDGRYIPMDRLRWYVFNFYETTSQTRVHWPSLQAGSAPVMRIGAGARLNWNCCGSLLTSAMVSDDLHGYSATYSGKDHGTSDPSTITGYAISANFAQSPDCCTSQASIPNFGFLQFRWNNRTGSSVGTGVATAYSDADPGWVMLGPGGATQWTSGPGRLLFGIKPTGAYQGQVGVFSKDHGSPSAGYSVASLCEARRRP